MVANSYHISIYRKLSMIDECTIGYPVVNAEATKRLKNTLLVTQYVVNEIEGSIASLDLEDAEPYSQGGDDILVSTNLPVSDSETPLARLVARGELQVGETSITMRNTRKDKKLITLDEAIRAWVNFQTDGVIIEKVSANGNSRGFYKMEALKDIVTMLGIEVPPKERKEGYVMAIRAWHSLHRAAIEEVRLENSTLVSEATMLGNIPTP